MIPVGGMIVEFVLRFWIGNEATDNVFDPRCGGDWSFFLSFLFAVRALVSFGSFSQVLHFAHFVQLS